MKRFISLNLFATNAACAVKNLLPLLYLLILPINVQADPVETVEHLHHTSHKTAVGIHGMAVFTDGHQLFASHMPLANSIHAHQVILSFKLKPEEDASLRRLLTENDLVSLMPERFDLMKLMAGDLNEFTATFYKGHFERGGKAVLKQVNVEVETIVFTADLTKDDNPNGHYFLIENKAGRALLVHRITNAPSFDQIIQVAVLSKAGEQGADNGIKTPLLAITEGQPMSLSEPKVISVEGYELKLIQGLYLETQDFQ